MSLIKDTWGQLVRRRLWPIALLLVGAVVAVPVLLAKDPSPPAPSAPVPSGGRTTAADDDALAKPVVAMASEESSGRRHVLGARKDPFQPAPQPKPKAPQSTTTSSSVTPSSPSSSTVADSHVSTGGPNGSTSLSVTSPSSSTGGSPSTTVTSPTTSPVTSPTAPAPAKKRLAPGTLTVRFGDASGDSLTRMKLKPGEAVPTVDDPVAIYLGRGADKRSAVFIVDSTVQPDGDGTCKPYAADCERIVLREGDTEFFDVKDEATGSVTAQFELDLLDIAGKRGTRAHRATRARAAHAGGHAHGARAHAPAAHGRMARVVSVLKPSL